MERLENSRWGFESNCFVCEAANPAGLGLEFYVDTDDDAVVVEFPLDQRFSDAPSYVHGGLVLAVMDEAMALGDDRPRRQLRGDQGDDDEVPGTGPRRRRLPRPRRIVPHPRRLLLVTHASASPASVIAPAAPTRSLFTAHQRLLHLRDREPPRLVDVRGRR